VVRDAGARRVHADGSTLTQALAIARRDAQSGAVVRSAGVLQLSGGCTATWDVAFDIGTCLMDLHLMGTDGRVRLDDFVLDWAGGFAIPLAGHVAEVEHQHGVVNPSGITVERVPAIRRQLVQLLENFAELSREPRGEAVEASMRASQRTQQLLDGVGAARLGVTAVHQAAALIAHFGMVRSCRGTLFVVSRRPSSRTDHCTAPRSSRCTVTIRPASRSFTGCLWTRCGTAAAGAVHPDGSVRT
jgi:hypothetical protein